MSSMVLWTMVKNLGLLLPFPRDDSQGSLPDTEYFSYSLDPFLVEAISDLSADGFRSVVKDFANDYLNGATHLNSVDEIVTEVVSTVLPTVVSNNKIDISFPVNI